MKTRPVKSRDYRDIIVFESWVFSPHENEKPTFSNSSGLKSVFEMLPFRDGSSVDGRPNQLKLRFQISSA